MNIDEIKKEIQNIKLSETEKGEMLERIFNSPVPSSYAPILSPWKFQHRILIYVLGCLVFLVVSGFGISYASLGSVPGESLYTFKVKVVEPTLDAVAFTPEFHAKLEANKAIRRLDEAQKLISKDKLTPAHRAEIESRFKQSTDNFNSVISSVKDNSGKKNLKASFEKSLNTRALNLKNARENIKPEDENQKEEADSLENTILERVSHESKPEEDSHLDEEN